MPMSIQFLSYFAGQPTGPDGAASPQNKKKRDHATRIHQEETRAERGAIVARSASCPWRHRRFVRRRRRIHLPPHRFGISSSISLPVDFPTLPARSTSNQWQEQRRCCVPRVRSSFFLRRLQFCPWAYRPFPFHLMREDTLIEDLAGIWNLGGS
jgi:hypothetical protein